MTRQAAVFLLVAVAACGGRSADTTSAPDRAGGFPVVVRGVEIPGVPQRIVSLSATHTEVLYEIGAGPSIVATDLFSDYPAAAAATEKVDAFNLSVEAVAAFDTDLVILSYDPGDAVAGLAALGIPAVLFAPPGPTDLDEVFAEWRDLGISVGLPEETEDLIGSVTRDIEEVIEGVPQTVRAFTYFIELDATLFTAGAGTLIDFLLGRLGLVNIVEPAAGPFVQLSPESLVDADPDFYFLADTVCCGESGETVAARPGFDVLGAVRNENIVALDDDVVSRWGPRIVDFVRTVAKEVYGI